MNSYERVFAAVSFEPTDHTPVIPQVFGYAAVHAGVPLVNYLTDGAVLARAQLLAVETFGYDAVFAVMDVCIETEALGSVLEYRKHHYPYIKTHALTSIPELDSLASLDPRSSGRIPELLNSIRIMRRTMNGSIPVISVVLGPMTLATQLMGMEKALYAAIDDISSFNQLLDFSSDVAIRLGEAQVEAGADIICLFDPASSCDVIPPQFFREFVAERTSRILSAFHRAGAPCCFLHITGHIEPILKYLPEADIDLLNIDYSVNPYRTRELLPDVCLNGNLKSLLFTSASPDSVISESLTLVESFAGHSGFILSSGCEIPLESNPLNIHALVSTA